MNIKVFLGIFFLSFFMVAPNDIKLDYAFLKSKKNQDSINQKIAWSSKYKLSWDDFKCSPDTSMINVNAIASCEIMILDAEYKNEIPYYKLKCFFNKNKSWTVVNDKDILKHEQLHFDIYELYTRKIRKSFDSLNVKKNKDISIYEKIYTEYGKKCNNRNELYDNEVYFNEVKQKQWIDRINKELLVYKDYYEE